ncbi:MAG: CvpA family protein [Alphaproteobacteria bacterium]|nr:CvpA family protein [Alphaproteobacteria bacterium]
MQLNNLDVILIILTLLSMVISLVRGLVKEVLSIIGWVLASIFIFYLLPYLTPLVKHYVASSTTAMFVAALVLLIIFYIMWFFATFKMLKTLRKSKLSGLDRGLGLVFGALRAFLLVILFHILLSTMLPEDAKNPFFADSKYFAVAGDFSEPIKNLIPQETLEKLSEKAKVKRASDKEDSASLFEKLAEPRIKKISEEPQNNEEEGYDKAETKSLDRLIETEVEEP